jgi:hypothetical protein
MLQFQAYYGEGGDFSPEERRNNYFLYEMQKNGLRFGKGQCIMKKKLGEGFHAYRKE